MSDEGQLTAAELVQAGRYLDAAQQFRAQGDFSKAVELYERVWDFQQAAACAHEGGDLPRALSNALKAKHIVSVEQYAAELQDMGEDGKRQALEIFAKGRHYAKAGKVAEELGELATAAELYQKAHLDLHAARLLVLLKKDREAGRILDHAVRNLDDGPERCEASLQLGLIFGRRMQHQDAVRALQVATTEAASKETRQAAQHALVGEFMALGMRDAATRILLQLREQDSTIVANVDSFLRDARGEPKRFDLQEARVIGGRYRLKKFLGAGASGRVYRVVDEVTGKIFALKLLSASHAHGGEPYQRFAREAQLTKSLSHPNIVEVYDVSADLGYLVMELMAGSLEQKLANNSHKLTPTAARRMCLDILGGLELAHQRGIIHRDVKPANIFFDARGVAKLGDFGVAHLLDLGQTQTGGLIGTLAYMSPEQITGAPLTIAADLYGIGVTLYESLCGRLPFLGPDFVAQHLGEEPPLPSSISDCGEFWDDILLRLLAKNPGERFASLDALRRELQALELNEHGVLILGRSRRKKSVSASYGTVSSTMAVVSEAAAHGELERYAYESPLGQTSVAELSRAIDTILNRSVIFERAHEPLTQAAEQRLYALARGGGPFLQRVLGYDRATKLAIFEAPSGSPIGSREEPMSTRLASRLLGRLARAIAPLHASDRVHGQIHGETVLMDDRGHPTVLVCGLEPVFETSAQPATAQQDVDAIMVVVATAVSSDRAAIVEDYPPGDKRYCEQLIDGLLPGIASHVRQMLLEMSTCDGEELYALAEAMDTLLIEYKFRPELDERSRPDSTV